MTWEADDGTPSAPVGDVLDALGVQGVLRPGDLPSAAVVLLRVVDEDGAVRLQAAWSDGLAWFDRLGMLHAAIACETAADG